MLILPVLFGLNFLAELTFKADTVEIEKRTNRYELMDIDE